MEADNRKYQQIRRKLQNVLQQREQGEVNTTSWLNDTFHAYDGIKMTDNTGSEWQTTSKMRKEKRT